MTRGDWLTFAVLVIFLAGFGLALVEGWAFR